MVLKQFVLDCSVAYLELAVRRRLGMATIDQRLTEAAIACGVFIENPILKNLQLE
jgi:hypothetical protein